MLKCATRIPSRALSSSLGSIGANKFDEHAFRAACGDEWCRHGRIPCGLYDSNRSQLSKDLRAGNVHCLVWSAPGDGWEVDGGHSSEAIRLDWLCEQLASLTDPSIRPAVVCLCMHVGARAAARQAVGRAQRDDCSVQVRGEHARPRAHRAEAPHTDDGGERACGLFEWRRRRAV